MKANELKNYFLANKNNWVFLNEVINGKSVQIKAFIGNTVDLQVLKINGLSAAKYNYQSVTKTVNHIFEMINH